MAETKGVVDGGCLRNQPHRAADDEQSRRGKVTHPTIAVGRLLPTIIARCVDVGGQGRAAMACRFRSPFAMQNERALGYCHQTMIVAAYRGSDLIMA